MERDKYNIHCKEEDDTMAAVGKNFVYEMKVNKENPKKEPVISKELLELCKKVANKYPRK